MKLFDPALRGVFIFPQYCDVIFEVAQRFSEENYLRDYLTSSTTILRIGLMLKENWWRSIEETAIIVEIYE